MQRNFFRKFRLTKKSSIKPLVIIVAVLTVGLLIAGYLDARSELRKAQIEKKGGEEAASLIEQVGRYIELPQDETPTVATVNDVSTLQDQLFFEQAQNGDKVIVYAQYGRAILYRPSENKIIEYAPVNYD